MTFNRLKYIVFSGLAGVLFTIFIYNFDGILNFLNFLYEKPISVHIGVIIFYYYLFIFLRKKLAYKSIVIFIISIVTPILIDASVLITNTELIPKRFPFASIFPLIGAGLGYLKTHYKKIYFKFSVVVVVCFLFLCQKYIIPKILYYSFQKNSPQVVNNIFTNKFYTVLGNSILLRDTNFAKCTLIEGFFKGCLPCEQKKSELIKLRNTFSKEDLNIIFICDGTITSFHNFIEYSTINKKDGITFLYDKDSILKKQLKINGYPFEILTKNEDVINTFMGYDEIVSHEYLQNQIKRIQRTIQ